MARSGRLVIIDKRAASQRGGNPDFARADTLTEKRMRGGAENFGFTAGRLIRHERLMPDGTWKRIYPRDEPKEEDEGKGGLVILPGPQGAHRRKIVIPGQAQKGGKGKLILPPGGNYNPYNDQDGKGKDADEAGPDEIGDDDAYGDIDDDYIEGLPCTRDGRDMGFGMDSDEFEGRRWLGKQKP